MTGDQRPGTQPEGQAPATLSDHAPFAATSGWFRRHFNDPRPTITLTAENIRALGLGYAIVTSEAVIEPSTVFSHGGETVTVKRLASGYFHLRGVGPCNWAQPETWPCAEETLEASFFGEAGESFKRAVRIENERLLGA